MISNGTPDLTNYDEEDLIRWNRLENDLDEIFSNIFFSIGGNRYGSISPI